MPSFNPVFKRGGGHTRSNLTDLTAPDLIGLLVIPIINQTYFGQVTYNN